jgi:hypothetical protein
MKSNIMNRRQGPLLRTVFERTSRKAERPIVLAIACRAVLHTLATPLIGVLSAQAVWSVDEQPVTIVNAVSRGGQSVFMHAAAAVRLADGTLVVGDDHDGQLRFFDRSGQLVRKVGGLGNGPNEFRHILWMGICGGDSISVWDFVQRRMKIVSASGSIIRQYAVPSDTIVAAAPQVMACSRGGMVAFQSEGRPNPSEKVSSPFIRGNAPVWIVDRDGRRMREAWRGPTTEMALVARGAAPRPLGRRTSIAFSNEELFIATADSGLLHAFSLASGSGRTVRVTSRRQKAEPRDHEQAVNEVLASVHGPPPQIIDRIRQELLKLPMPEWLVPFDQLLVDSDALLWTVTNTSNDATLLQAHGNKGELIAQARIAGRMKIFEIGRDYVVGVKETAEGEQQVVVLTLRRSS